MQSALNEFIKNWDCSYNNYFCKLDSRYCSFFVSTTYLSAIVAFVILLSLLWEFGKKCGLKIASIKNKEYARNIIETATLSSIFGFVIERIMLPFANDIENIAITVFLSILFIMLPIIVFLILRLKKNGDIMWIDFLARTR